MQNKSINIFFNINQFAKEALLHWVKEHTDSEPIFIVDEESILKNINFPYSIFSINEVVPINSKQEESIFRQWHHYQKFFTQKLVLNFNGINLLTDLFFNHNFESVMRYAVAYLTLSQKFDHVIIALSFDPNRYFNTIIQLANLKNRTNKKSILYFNHKKNGFCNAGTYFYIRNFVNTVTKSILNIGSKFCLSLKARVRLLYQRPTSPIHLQDYSQNLHMDTTRKQQVNREEQEGNPCLILTTSEPLYRNNFNIVYKKLNEKLQKLPFTIAMTPQAAQAAKEDGITYITLDFIKKLISIKFFFQSCFLFFTFIPQIISHQFILRSIYFKNPQHDLWRYQIHTLLSMPKLPLTLIKNLIAIQKIDYLFKTQNPTIIYKDTAKTIYDSRIAGLARKRNIPVSASIFASISSSYRNFNIYPCDFITLLGEKQKATFKKYGYQDAQLLAVGQPELDLIKQKWDKTSAQNYLFKQFPNSSADDFFILIATSTIDRENEKIWIQAISHYAIQQKQLIHILIKPHPSVRNFYEDCSKLPHITLLPNTTELYPLIISANLVVTDLSHAGKLAIFFKKPLMVANFSGKSFGYNNFDKDGVAWLATHQQEIHEIIDGVLEGKLIPDYERYDAYIRQNLTSDDGKAADRIVDLLLHFPKPLSN